MNWLSIRFPLSSADIQKLEQKLDVELPRDYAEQIGPINGAALKNARIIIPSLGEVPYCRNVPLHKDARAGIFDLVNIFNPGAITLFPFGAVGNGDYFCFDLSAGTVVLYLHELQTTMYVCDTFTQLLSLLVQDDPNIP